MNKIYTSIPQGYGECPVCNGTGRMGVDQYQRPYVNVISGYDPVTDTLSCNNCGAQRMFGQSTGYSKLDPDGTACKHVYTGVNAGRCYTKYTCTNCGDRYDIDSSD